MTKVVTDNGTFEIGQRVFEEKQAANAALAALKGGE